ncbi:uncharacterized protein TNCT_330361 [Trichonephila clavata]|uniref:Uncharacterized protein n=1 Tax=Trichonephila clavata TaxID=2740835 RepID=A0A8X6JC38_TRICU|nr:uncharacterized protein TNCT_330361 [Trichonephila clavata]
MDECNHCLKLWLKAADIKNISTSFLNEYSAIQQFAHLVESTMSPEVLWLCAANFTDLFSSLSNVLGFHSNSNPIYRTEKVIYTSLNLLAFFAIIFFAAEVCRKDQKLRETSKKAAFMLSLSNESREHGKLLYRFIESREEIILSAWGVFNFTRSFLLASTASLISFNLLLVQLDTYKANKV